jgi:hypothetical protein
MNEKTKNVFEQLQESLATIIDELSSVNDALYIVATTAIDLNDKLDILGSKLDALTGAATKVIEPVTEQPAVKKPEIPKFSFTKLRAETK